VYRQSGAIDGNVEAIVIETTQKVYLTLPEDKPVGSKITVSNYNSWSGNVLAPSGEQILGYSKVSLRPRQTVIFIKQTQTLWVVV